IDLAPPDRALGAVHRAGDVTTSQVPHVDGVRGEDLGQAHQNTTGELASRPASRRISMARGAYWTFPGAAESSLVPENDPRPSDLNPPMAVPFRSPVSSRNSAWAQVASRRAERRAASCGRPWASVS